MFIKFIRSIIVPPSTPVTTVMSFDTSLVQNISEIVQNIIYLLAF